MKMQNLVQQQNDFATRLKAAKAAKAQQERIVRWSSQKAQVSIRSLVLGFLTRNEQ